MIDRIEEYKNKRRKRRTKRIIFALFFVAFATMLSWFFESQATTTVILTTHADVDSNSNVNSGLSQRGFVTADALQELLNSVDVVAGVDAIYATPLRATQETAEPLMKSLDIPITLVEDVSAVEGLIETIMAKHKGKIILVVTHPDVLPKLVAELHGSKNIEPIDPSKDNKLFIVSVPWFGKVKTLQLNYAF